MDRLVGARLGRYEVSAVLGAGGMGAVYRGRDTDLGREVAIKVLPEAVREDPERLERFDREIHAVARLSHPNIVEIFDFGLSDGTPYAVMELLDGRSLRDRMRGRPLPYETALEIGVAIAAGLGAAHHAGILHRDVKPENVFLTAGGTVKILDFGLASRIPPRGPAVDGEADTETLEASLTGEGSIVGTTAYMSPEQVRGQPLDARSDIFSLGCVLYEMLTGVHPFRRDTRVDTMSAILSADPPRLASLVPEVPPAVDRLVRRCLEKDPDRRFESARDVAYAIGAISRVQTDAWTPVEPRRRFAWTRWALAAAGVAAAALVLGLAWRLLEGPPPLPEPLRVTVARLEAAPDHAELAAGLTEHLAAGLEQIAQRASEIAWVLPGGDAGDRDPDGLERLARTYGVTAGVTGRLRIDDGDVRLDLEVVDPSTGDVLRASRVTGSLGNVSALQLEPVLEVAGMLGVPRRADVERLLARRSTTLTSAFVGLLRGTGAAALAGDDVEQLEVAHRMLEQAIEADPQFVSAQLASARVALRLSGATRDPAWRDDARGVLDAAVAADPSRAEAFELAARVERRAGRVDDAVAALESAVRAEPEDGEAAMELAREYARQERWDAARRSFQRAIHLRPGYWPAHHWLARMDLERGEYEAAANQFRQVAAAVPRDPVGLVNLAAVYQYMGQLDRAEEVSLRVLELSPDDKHTLTNLCSIYFQQARYADAVEMCERVVEVAPEDFRSWGNLAYALLYGADPSLAGEAFEQAVELGEARRAASPGDTDTLVLLASFYAGLGEIETGRERLLAAVALGPSSPDVLIQIAEAFEDLRDRGRALEWVAKAFEAGAAPARFETRPALRDLVTDPRYRRLADARDASPPGAPKGG